jgi:hypothetical protein
MARPIHGDRGGRDAGGSRHRLVSGRRQLPFPTTSLGRTGDPLADGGAIRRPADTIGNAGGLGSACGAQRTADLRPGRPVEVRRGLGADAAAVAGGGQPRPDGPRPDLRISPGEAAGRRDRPRNPADRSAGPVREPDGGDGRGGLAHHHDGSSPSPRASSSRSTTGTKTATPMRIPSFAITVSWRRISWSAAGSGARTT